MNPYVYIIGMWFITAIIRILPLLILRRPIKNRFLRSFFYYVPYVTLAVMTFPAIVNATASPLAGAVALVAGIVLAWIGANMITVSATCCVVVLILELFTARQSMEQTRLSRRESMLPVSTETTAVARPLSMVLCLLRSRRLNIPMAYWRNSSATCLTRHHARAVSQV